MSIVYIIQLLYNYCHYITIDFFEMARVIFPTSAWLKIKPVSGPFERRQFQTATVCHQEIHGQKPSIFP